jgi:ATP-dependent RNA helicase RhlE
VVRRRPTQEFTITPSFDSLGLQAELLRAVAAQGYTQPTPIQLQAIPQVLAARDLLAAAQTGTGKTAAFVLPLLQRLNAGAAAVSRAPRALVLVPTRELAAQVADSVRDYGRYVPQRCAVIFGGVGFQPQADALKRGVDIVVATPGRLLDHVQQKTIDLRHISILVLDEADRMLDMGFIPAIRRILALLPKRRQNLLFSATFSPEIRELAHSFLTEPATVEVARRNAPAELVSQAAYPVDAGHKRELLARLITQGDWHQVLVFTRTKHGANRLAQQLERDGITADAIHGNKSQGHRTRTLADFKRGELRVLVATDIAARGLDIEALPHVVNYDLPHVPEDYVHRIGRTGRAGMEGEAVSLVSREEQAQLAAIERLINRTIERRTVEGFEPVAGTSQAEPRRASAKPAPARGRDTAPDRRPHRKGSQPARGQGQAQSRQGSERRPRTTDAAKAGRDGASRADAPAPAHAESRTAPRPQGRLRAAMAALLGGRGSR